MPFVVVGTSLLFDWLLTILGQTGVSNKPGVITTTGSESTTLSSSALTNGPRHLDDGGKRRWRTTSLGGRWDTALRTKRRDSSVQSRVSSLDDDNNNTATATTRWQGGDGEVGQGGGAPTTRLSSTVTCNKYLRVSCTIKRCRVVSFWYISRHTLPTFLRTMPKALGCREISAELRGLICQQAAAGTPLSSNRFLLNRPLHTIQSIVKRSTNERSDYENAPRSGRPPKLTDRALRCLSLSVSCDRRQILQDITDSINTDIPAPVCARTVHTALKTRLGISSRIAAKKPSITAAQNEKRLEWARDHVNWTMENWKMVIWMDESSVEIVKESRTCTVWRREGERYREECLVPTFKSGRKSIMVWGCISYGKWGPLVRMQRLCRFNPCWTLVGLLCGEIRCSGGSIGHGGWCTFPLCKGHTEIQGMQLYGDDSTPTSVTPSQPDRACVETAEGFGQ